MPEFSQGSGKVYRQACDSVSIQEVLCRIEVDNPNRQIAYYRSRNVVLGQTMEYLAVGDFPMAQVAWEDFAKQGSAGLYRGLEALEDEPAAMAGYLSYEAGYAFEERWAGLQVPPEGYVYRFYSISCWYERSLDTGRAELCWVEGCTEGVRREFQEFLRECGSLKVHHGDCLLVGAGESIAEVARYGELSDREYCRKVERIKQDIYAGRYYELNFTQRFRKTSDTNPVEVFCRILGELEPAQAFFAVFPDEVICSASPEVYLQKSGNDVISRPIKGSYVVTAEDTEKLHAEHTMVVDLTRNDLGRISNLAPVRVDEFMGVEKFGKHHHYVSTVRGKTTYGLVDILRDTYPAASITGAPKVEVVTAIGEFEESPRGIYTGSCGWISPGGQLDLNVAIRTFRARRDGDQWAYELGSGGAIVADSDPMEEYQECLMKAVPLLDILLRVEYKRDETV